MASYHPHHNLQDTAANNTDPSKSVTLTLPSLPCIPSHPVGGASSYPFTTPHLKRLHAVLYLGFRSVLELGS
jgi:hypothetical protein